MTYRLIAAAASLAITVACRPSGESADAPPPTDSITVAGDFLTPESVLYDAVMDVYVVSNINGSPTDKDDNGFLSRVAPSGEILELRWVDGASDTVTLHAPKGMAIKGDTLFVTDIDEVRMFDRTTGSPLGSRSVPGATFLNDIAVGPDGTVYVTDSGLRPDFSPSGTDAVYRFAAGGRAVPVASGAALGRPNGIVPDGADVIIVSFGSNEAYRLDARGGRTALPTPPGGSFDGVVRLADGTLLVSSWTDSSVSRLAPGATTFEHLVRGVASPADIGFDTRRNRVLIPLFGENRIEIRPVP